MRTRTLLSSFTLALTLLGCGGDPTVVVDAAITIDAPPMATDFEGMWLMTELVVDDAGTPRTLRRDGVPQALRGDVLLTPTGPYTATLDLRQALLSEGLLVSPVFHDVDAVLLEPDRWVLTTGDGEVVVFTTARTGERLVLTHDATDPRDTATDPPRSLIVERVTPWSSALVGAWDLVSITTGGQTVTAGACTPTAIPELWLTLTMRIDISPRLLFTRVMTTRRYADRACTQLTNEQSSTQAGMGEEVDRSALRIWATEGQRSEYQAFDLAIASELVTLARTACLPSPACLESAPTQVVVRRRGP